MWAPKKLFSWRRHSTKRTPFTGDWVLAEKGGALKNVFSDSGRSDAAARDSQELFSWRSFIAKRTAGYRERVLTYKRFSYHRRCSEEGSLSNRLKSHRKSVLMRRAQLQHEEEAFFNVEEVVLKVRIWCERRCARPQVLLSPNLAICI